MIQLWFTEAPEPKYSSVQILTTAGVTVQTVALTVTPEDPNRAAGALAGLTDGAYVVSWRTVSAVDAHESVGSFPIGIGAGPEVEAFLAAAMSGTTVPEATVSRTALRTVTYVGASLALGAMAFGAIVLGPAAAGLRSRGTITVADVGALARSTWRVAVVGLITSVVALAWSVVAQAADGAGTRPIDVVVAGLGSGSPLTVLMAGTRFGQVASARAVGLLLLIAALAAVHDTRRARPDQGAGRRRWAVATLIAALGPVTIGLNSHSAAQTLETGAAVVNWVHLVAMGTWVGGIVTLTVATATARVASDARRAVVAALVGRFSPLAAGCVAALSLTGAWQAWLLVGSVDALLGTPHGWALQLKLALVAACLAVAAINLAWTRPRLAKVAISREAGRAPGVGAMDVLAATTGMAQVIMMAVLLVTGTLTQLPPAKEAHIEATRGTFREVTVDGARLRLRLNPGQPGYNVASVWATDRAGPVADASARLVVRMTDHDMGETEVRLIPQESGTFVAGTGVFSMSGTYEVEAIVRRAGSDDVRAIFPEVTYAGVPVEGLALGAVRRAPMDAQALQNPVPFGDDSIGRGRQIYMQSCAACHGVGGKGDGPAALAIRPALPNLGVHVPLHPDGELWWFITNGIAGRPMPAWRDVLTDDERWDVVNYLRAALVP